MTVWQRLKAYVFARRENPFAKKTKVRESLIESRTCSYAKAEGWTPYKFVSPGRRGVPDHFFAKAPRRLIFIEFKAQGEVSSDQQRREQQRLRDMGFEVYECWSVEQGRAIFAPL